MFKNRIRLPFYISEPQFPAEARRFRLANGESKTLSVTLRKTYELFTDWLTEQWHQRLVVALNHDEVTIEGEKYIGNVVMDGEYDIAWQKFLDYPLGQASARVQVSPFNVTNDNCQTCETMTQLSLVDDDAGELAEGSSNEINVFANDSICCAPVEAEITYFDPLYVDSVTIDATTGVMTINIKNPVATTAVPVVLATYRVTCPDGTYDDADVAGTVTGSIEACDIPQLDVVEFGTGTETTVTWTGPEIGQYEWQLYSCEDLSTMLDSGTSLTNFVTFDDGVLEQGACYQLCVRQDCGDGNLSAWNCFEFVTEPAAPDQCGRFRVTAFDGTGEPNGYEFSYMACNGSINPGIVFNNSFKLVCMLHDPVTFEPTYFVGGPHIGIEYVEPC